MTIPTATPLDAALHPDGGDHALRSTDRQPVIDAPSGGPQANGRPGRGPDLRLTQLRRFQWAVRATLALGVAASVCANVLHAQHNPIAEAIAAWPPLALMLTVELISRVPVYRQTLAVVRLLATACIAGIAAYVSYFHMAALVSRFGEHQPNPYLLPFSVDGLIVVASVSLVELAGRIRTIRDVMPGTQLAGLPPVNDPPLSHGETVSASLAERARRNGHAGTTEQNARPLRTAAQPAAAPFIPAPLAPLPVEPTLPDEPSPLRTPAPTKADEPTDTDDPAMQPPNEPPSTTPPPPSLPAEPPTTEPPSIGRSVDGADEPNEDCNEVHDPDLAALLPAARAARDILRHQHRGLTRDSLAAQLRRDGHTIRTSRVSALLNLLRSDDPAIVNGGGHQG